MLEMYKQHLADRGSTSLDVRVRPGARRTMLKSILDDGSIKIDIAAEPEDGKANMELVRFLAGEFNVSRDQVEILSGHMSGRKRVLLTL
jgi:uncharacterized protein (TIGR00251 family)